MPDSADLIVEYRRSIFLKMLFVLFCLILTVVVVGISLGVGQGITFTESYEIIFNHIFGNSYPFRSEMWWKDHFIWNNVMPRIVIGIIGGIGLAVGGAVMQSVMSNPLADPYTTGISSGASFGAVAAIIAGVSFTTMAGTYGIVGNAFLGAMIPAISVILISRYIQSSPATLILVGTAISYFFNALVTLMMISATAENLQAAYLWQIGSLSGMSWSKVPLMMVLISIGSIISLAFSRKLNLLTLGDKSAKSLGLDVDQFRLICLILLSVMTASVISFTGIIGFVGLISPHIVRLVIGSDNRLVIPASMMMGALLLLSCDFISRIISSMMEIPVGVVMSMVGSPIFLLLIIGRNRNKAGIY